MLPQSNCTSYQWRHCLTVIYRNVTLTNKLYTCLEMWLYVQIFRHCQQFNLKEYQDLFCASLSTPHLSNYEFEKISWEDIKPIISNTISKLHLPCLVRGNHWGNSVTYEIVTLNWLSFILWSSYTNALW